MNSATSGGWWDRTSSRKYPATVWRSSRTRPPRWRDQASPGRDRSHLQPGRPSLAAPVNQGQLWLVQPDAEPGQKTPGLLYREGQVPVPQLDQILVRPHPVHPQRRVNPAGHYHLQRRRMILHQPAQGIGAGRPGQVKVVNDQYPYPSGRQVVSQRGHCIGRYLAIEADQLAGILADRWLSKAIPRGLDDGSDEPDRVGIGRVTAQPRRRPLRAAASQSARSMVLPAPAGPTTRARRTCPPRSSRSSTRPAHEPRHQLGDTEFRGREPGSARARLSDHCRFGNSASASYSATPPAWPSGSGTEASPGRWDDFTAGGREKPPC